METDQAKPTPDFLDEQDAINRINAYSKDDGKELLSLVRNDRFCDGLLINAFESGLILELKYSIKQQVHEI